MRLSGLIGNQALRHYYAQLVVEVCWGPEVCLDGTSFIWASRISSLASRIHVAFETVFVNYCRLLNKKQLTTLQSGLFHGVQNLQLL